MSAPGPPEAPDASMVETKAPPEASLHEKILIEFVGRLRTHEHVGEGVAAALAQLLRRPKMPKRESIVGTVRTALGGKDGADGSAP